MNGLNKIVVICPFAAWLPNGKPNPKNYPYWQNVINEIKKYPFVKVIQVGGDIIKPFENIDNYLFNVDLDYIINLVNSSDLWVSGDTFLQHLVYRYIPHKHGIVIWGPSDPKYFGYDSNTNLYKDSMFFRLNQFDIWLNEQYDETIWVHPDIVVEEIKNKLNLR